ncbi:MAG: DNA methyltransferase, partial [Planctomycetota bacterium]
IIRASSEEGDTVADFFCGSGTTLAVAKRLGRRYLGCDINPAAVEIAAQRTGSSVYGLASCHPAL